MIALYVLTDPRDDGALTLLALTKAARSVRDHMGIIVRHEDEGLAAKISAMATEHGAVCFIKCRKNGVIRDRAHHGGVHIGALHEGDEVPGGTFTASAHDVDEAVRAKGATAILVGPIFDVPDKAPARGVALIRECRAALPTSPLYALGGIDASNALICVREGADGVAVIRAVIHAEDPAVAARTLVEHVEIARFAQAMRARFNLRADRDPRQTARKKPRRTS